jgi:hypothetical protein
LKLAALASIITILRPNTTTTRSLARGETPVPSMWRATLVSLPYGAERDWVRNVLAAGSCTLERAGQRIPLIEPTLLGQREGTAQLRWPVRKGLRLLRVKAVLMLSADPIVADTHH